MIKSIADLQEIKKTYEEKMAGYKYQALVCFGTGCTSSGCKVIRDTLIEEIEKYGLDLIGVVPQDQEVYEYDCDGRPTVRLEDDNPARKAVNEIAQKLFG
jgi:hypothetical protein